MAATGLPRRGPVSLGRDGVFLLPLGIALFFIAAVSLALLGYAGRWRRICEVQLELDRCVARAAWEGARALNLIEGINVEIEALRAAIAAAMASFQAPTVASLQATLAASVTAQEVLLRTWEANRFAWAARHGCGGWRNLAPPMEKPAWFRLPPDAIGPQSLTWAPSAPRRFSLRVYHPSPPRDSAARIEGDSDALVHHWSARWASAGPPGPGVD